MNEMQWSPPQDNWYKLNADAAVMVSKAQLVLFYKFKEQSGLILEGLKKKKPSRIKASATFNILFEFYFFKIPD